MPAELAGQRLLLERAAAGPQEAFARLYDAQVEGAYRYLLEPTRPRLEPTRPRLEPTRPRLEPSRLPGPCVRPPPATTGTPDPGRAATSPAVPGAPEPGG